LTYCSKNVIFAYYLLFCNIKNKGIGTGETCPTPNLCEFWAFLQLPEDVEDTFFVISDSSEKGQF